MDAVSTKCKNATTGNKTMSVMGSNLIGYVSIKYFVQEQTVSTELYISAL